MTTDMSDHKLPQELQTIDLTDDTSEEIECSEKSMSCEAIGGYDKTSFDRFGDDLTQLLLSYLSVEDKFRYECLSKVVRNNIFGHQYKVIVVSDEPDYVTDNRNSIRINLSVTNPELIRSVFNKWYALTELEIRGKDVALDQTLPILADNCYYLKSLTIIHSYYSHVSRDVIDYFGRRCGPLLKTLSFGIGIPDSAVRRLLTFTPNLEELTANHMYFILTDEIKWRVMQSRRQTGSKLPMLRAAEFLSFPSDPELEQFTEEYGNSSKVTLSLHSDLNSYTNRLIHLKCSDHLSRVRELTLALPNKDQTLLQQLVTHCPNLLTLRISIHSNYMMEGFLRLIGRFTTLVELKVKIIKVADQVLKPNYGCVRDLKSITGLKQLTLDMEMSDQTLIAIDKYLPQLQSLSLKALENISDKSLEVISSLKQLNRFVIELSPISLAAQKSITDSGVQQLVANCHRLKRLVLSEIRLRRAESGVTSYSISLKSIESMAMKAKLNPKVNHYLSVNQTLFRQINCDFDSLSLPQNFKFNII